MVVTLKLFHETIIESGEKRFYGVDGIDGRKESETLEGIEEIVNKFVESKNGIELEIRLQIPYVEDPYITKVIRKPNLNRTEVYRILEPNEVPESLKKYVKPFH